MPNSGFVLGSLFLQRIAASHEMVYSLLVSPLVSPLVLLVFLLVLADSGLVTAVSPLVCPFVSPLSPAVSDFSTACIPLASPVVSEQD